MASSYQYVKNSRTRLKERAVYVMGDKCQCCGYNKCLQALEFHHLDPLQKDFTLSDNTNRSWENVQQEIQKCILVCANCHREIHAGLIDDSVLKSSFSVERAIEISQLITNLKTHKIYYCKNCGAEVSKGNDRCPSCAAIASRSVVWPEREVLKKLIRTTPFVQIADQYHVTDNAVRKWCDKYNLPRRVSDIKQISDEEWEKI